VCKISYILYKHISEKYNSIPNFAEVSGIAQQELSAVLLKENIVREISLGLEIFKFLNLDIEKLLLDGEIAEIGGGEQAVGEFRDRYIRLSEVEKKKVVEFMDSFD